MSQTWPYFMIRPQSQIGVLPKDNNWNVERNGAIVTYQSSCIQRLIPPGRNCFFERNFRIRYFVRRKYVCDCHTSIVMFPWKITCDNWCVEVCLWLSGYIIMGLIAVFGKPLPTMLLMIQLKHWKKWVQIFAKWRREHNSCSGRWSHWYTLQYTACNTLKHTAAHCNVESATVTRQHHTATHCNKLQHTVTWHTVKHCNMLQHTTTLTATHWNTLQHSTTHNTVALGLWPFPPFDAHTNRCVT